MNHRTIEQLEQRVKELEEKAKKPRPADEPDAEEKTKAKDEPEASKEEMFFNELTDDTLERFTDGLLIVLGEMEQEGVISEIENPEQARSALMAVIRRLYMQKSMVARQSRKFARFGAKQFLRKQRTKLTRSMS